MTDERREAEELVEEAAIAMLGGYAFKGASVTKHDRAAARAVVRLVLERAAAVAYESAVYGDPSKYAREVRKDILALIPQEDTP